MNIYLLRRPEEDISYDQMTQCVVAAENGRAARLTASHYRGDEGEAVWTDIMRSSCNKIGVAARNVQPGMIVRNFWAG